ncbi:UDP-N-acetylmuramate dehydrogenase [Domibacillus aminovorans]|uniref:UDP-N-acetylenolpyruvoylglucosamine reductase n=1 Tax=Domibacillus aminovorans TaxID=29332 RepID=A0A177L780_9BACI|nr:UDP-N-acetylenolpyruvoylglucosamine reductase [Domibacillus aminovorans]
MDALQIVNELKTKIDEKTIELFFPLWKHTYTKTGGTADIFIKPKHIQDLQLVIEYAQSYHIPLTVLGNGSNVLVRDKGLRGIVITLEHFNTIAVEGNQIIAGSGAKIIDVSHTALEHHLTGLEFACGIPGSVGGALVMNAGAYGGETSTVLKKATVFSHSGELIDLEEKDFHFGYRKSVFTEKDYIIVEALFELQPGEHAKIKEEMDTFTALREAKQPLEYPSCGSVFKRPTGYFAGKLIQDSGLQGARIGGAEISTKHAGFIVNVDGASSTDYLKLIQHAQDTVREKFGVELETEVKIIGED